jgi:hypothetical protein
LPESERERTHLEVDAEIIRLLLIADAADDAPASEDGAPGSLSTGRGGRGGRTRHD